MSWNLFLFSYCLFLFFCHFEKWLNAWAEPVLNWLVGHDFMQKCFEDFCLLFTFVLISFYWLTHTHTHTHNIYIIYMSVHIFSTYLSYVFIHTHTHTHIYIYYIVIHSQTISLYHNSSLWLDTRDARSGDRNLGNFTPGYSTAQAPTKWTYEKGVKHTHKYIYIYIYIYI